MEFTVDSQELAACLRKIGRVHSGLRYGEVSIKAWPNSLSLTCAGSSGASTCSIKLKEKSTGGDACVKMSWLYSIPALGKGPVKFSLVDGNLSAEIGNTKLSSNAGQGAAPVRTVTGEEVALKSGPLRRAIRQAIKATGKGSWGAHSAEALTLDFRTEGEGIIAATDYKRCTVVKIPTVGSMPDMIHMDSKSAHILLGPVKNTDATLTFDEFASVVSYCDDEITANIPTESMKPPKFGRFIDVQDDWDVLVVDKCSELRDAVKRAKCERISIMADDGWLYVSSIESPNSYVTRVECSSSGPVVFFMQTKFLMDALAELNGRSRLCISYKDGPVVISSENTETSIMPLSRETIHGR